MRWYREHSDTLADLLLLTAFLAVAASLIAVLLSPSLRDVLTRVLSSVGTLAVAITAILGLRTWRRQASRALAQRLLRAALALTDRALDAAMSGGSSDVALSSLIDDQGMLIDSPWAPRTEVLGAVVRELKEKRDGFLRAKLDWTIALEEARSSAWIGVAEEGDKVSVLAESLSVQLQQVQAMAGLWLHVGRVGSPETRRTELKEQEGYFDAAPKDVSTAVKRLQQTLRLHLGL